MRSLILSTLAALAVAACDPLGPGTSGTLTLPAGDTTGFTTLELRWFPDVDGGFDLAGPPELSDSSIDTVTSESFPLATLAFPYDYSVGTGIGTSPTKVWRIVAWLAGDATKMWPNGSEPFATSTVTIDECGGSFDGYCGIVDGIDLVLQAPGT